MTRISRLSRAALVLCCLFVLPNAATAADLIVKLAGGGEVAFVGAVDRWDADGNARRKVDPKAKIDVPDVDAAARQVGPNTWRFGDLPAGRYDLVILARPRLRIEGFTFPPVLEFDEFFTHEDEAPAAAREFITRHVAQSRLYENKVAALHFAGNDKQVRVFLQLLRDEKTSYDAEFGEPVATIRHEVWQYTHRYGAWDKEKRVRIFDRLLMPTRELRTWTWLWEPTLGGVRVSDEDVTIEYTVPRELAADTHP